MSVKSKKVKKVKGARIYDFELPLYGVHYSVIIAENIEDSAKAAEQIYEGLTLTEVGPDTGGYAAKIMHPHVGIDFFILLTPGVSSPEIIPGICAHESLHISWYICNLLGIRPKWDNHEPQAYILQELFNNCMEAYNDYTNRLNKKKQ